MPLILRSPAEDTSDINSMTKRPCTLISESDNKYSLSPENEEDCTLLELPSPISRHGSLVGDPQLPVPPEFLDVSISIFVSK